MSSFIIQHPTNGLTCVIGKPGTELVHEAITEDGGNLRVITFEENYRYVENVLKEWRQSPAYIHVLSGELPQIHTSDDLIRFLENDELSVSDHIPNELRNELYDAMLDSPIAAFFTGNKPVSFCYAAAETETLWDISIDTVESYRNKGYAARTVCFMIDYMNGKGKRPVWGAEESNQASIKLAQKLDFKPVERIYLYNKK